MPDGFLFEGGRVLRRGRDEEGLTVLVEGTRITALGADARKRSRQRARHVERVDLDGAFLAPGFVDLHTHGARGVHFDSASRDELDSVLREHFIAHGVTRLLVSLCPAPPGRLESNVKRIAAAIRGRVGLGIAAGIHLEGPFLNPRRPGALPRKSFRRYEAGLVDALIDAGAGTIRTMTIAPELPGGHDLIAHLRRRRVVPAFGHSDGDYEDARAALRKGVRYVTHLFNAMNGVHHRAPGPVTAFLEDERARVELISDGYHVDDAVMRWVARLKPAEEICLVSDSVGPCGLRPGRYEFAGSTVRLENGRVTLPDGTLAGSALTLDRAFAHQVRRVERSPAEVSISASATPARIAGWQRTIGEIEVGRRADLVVLSPRYRVEQTWVGGERAFAR